MLGRKVFRTLQLLNSTKGHHAAIKPRNTESIVRSSKRFSRSKPASPSETYVFPMSLFPFTNTITPQVSQLGLPDCSTNFTSLEVSSSTRGPLRLGEGSETNPIDCVGSHSRRTEKGLWMGRRDIAQPAREVSTAPSNTSNQLLKLHFTS